MKNLASSITSTSHYSPSQPPQPPSLLAKLVNSLCFLCALLLLPPTLGFHRRQSSSADRVLTFNAMPPLLHYDTAMLLLRQQRVPPPQSYILNDNNDYIAHLCADADYRNRWINSQVRLKTCSEYDVVNVLGNVNFSQTTCTKEIVQQSTEACNVCLRGLFDLDQQSHFHVQNFNELIQRFQCANKTLERRGEVPHTLGDTHCDSCLTNYTAWVCSTNFNLYLPNITSIAIPPCDSWCADVERLCPYFSTTGEQDNGGEPVFLCSEAHYHYMTRARTLPSSSSTDQLCEFLARQHVNKRCCYAGFHLKRLNTLSVSSTDFAKSDACSLEKLCAAGADTENPTNPSNWSTIGLDLSSMTQSHSDTELLNLNATTVAAAHSIHGAAASALWCKLLISTTIQLVVIHWCWIRGLS